MADYTSIPPTAFQVGAYPFASTVQALEENPRAMFEGADGAPRLQNAAIENGAIGAEKFQQGLDEIAWVGSMSAQAGAAAVGSYGFLMLTSGEVASPGAIYSGSILSWAGVSTGGLATNTVTVAGIWRALGYGTATLFKRVE